MNKLEDFYFNNKDRKCKMQKWHHYFKIYDKHFSRFIGKSPKILEIGVKGGGSLELWNHYFDGDCEIYGIDINEECLDVPNKLGMTNVHIDIGDQESRTFWLKYLKDKPRFDIVIDDGGHTMRQQIVTFEELYDHVSDDGVYLCEDLHTSYWNDDFGGGYKKEDTFIEYSKNFADMLNIYFIKPWEIDPFKRQKYHKFRTTTSSVTYYDSVIVLEKQLDTNPHRESDI